MVFIHGKDVIHSDLSASQFLVDKNGDIRLSDFGGSSLQGSEAIVMENAPTFYHGMRILQILSRAIYLLFGLLSMISSSARNLTREWKNEKSSAYLQKEYFQC